MYHIFMDKGLKFLTPKIHDGLVQAVSFMNSIMNFTNNTVDFRIFLIFLCWVHADENQKKCTLHWPMCS